MEFLVSADLNTMVSDTITTTASMPNSKDFAKKKRANRSAKLKQCKRDARREQWLSQVCIVKNKEGKEWKDDMGRQQGCGGNGLGKLDSRISKDKDNEGFFIHQDSDYGSPPNSPVSHAVSGSNDSGINYMSNNNSSSSSSSGGTCVESCTEEDEGNDDCLDDWEAMADALAADEKDESAFPECKSMGGFNSSDEARNGLGMDHQNSRANGIKRATRAAFGNNHAWRPDDAFRPQILPTLSKQHSFPTTDRHYVNGGIPCQWACCVKSPVPLSCPICYEDLDTTDSSFLPCLCGFHLCLFCHRRILDGDGRCPSCRKPYEQSQAETEAITHGGSLGFWLTRSYSMSTST